MGNARPQAVGWETAYAKINLALHVRRRLPNGYHEIETIFAFLDRGDRLRVQPSDCLQLTIDGPFGAGLDQEDNLVTDAAKLLATHANIPAAAHIILEKNLPVSSGIGGGSADAAATLRLLNKFWDISLPLRELASLSDSLGADVPACVISQTCLGTGIGQDLVPVDDLALRGMRVLLVNPRVAISTAQIFRDWDGVDGGSLGDGDILSMSSKGRNDLERPAIAQLPLIKDILDKLSQTDPVLHRMSGSGATCFALFDDTEAADIAQFKLLQAMPEAWALTGEIR